MRRSETIMINLLLLPFIFWINHAFAVEMAYFDITKGNIKIKPHNPEANRMRFRGKFSLGSGNNGIDPVNEAVQVTIGPYSETIPAGSFIQRGKKEIWKYKGTNGKITRMFINLRRGKIKLNAKGINLNGIANPVTVSIQIGDDNGSLTTLFKENRILRYQ